MSPLNWLFIPIFFMFFLFFVMVGVWWLFVGEYSFFHKSNVLSENFETKNSKSISFFWSW